MTIEHPLRRALARVCSHATMERIIDPIFADIRWEDGRLTWRGCRSLVKALAVHGLTSIPSWFAAACADDDYALLRAAAFTVAGATIVAVALTSFPLSGGVGLFHTSLYALGMRLIPQVLVMSLPSMIILTIPAVFGGLGGARSIIARALLLTAAGLAMTIALTVSVLPRANQSHRGLVNGATLAWGPHETGFAAIRAQIRDFQRIQAIILQPSLSRDTHPSAPPRAHAILLRGHDVAHRRSDPRGRPITLTQTSIDQVRQYSEDTALMLEWFERVGYDADIAGLEQEFGRSLTKLPDWVRHARTS